MKHLKKYNEGLDRYRRKSESELEYEEKNREFTETLEESSNLLHDCLTFVGNSLASSRPDNDPADEPSDETKQEVVEQLKELNKHLSKFMKGRGYTA